ncbi:MAG: diphosphate--fructose-6-phosphate 1-phosphotransferase [Candidatus Goldbacteria bacterium]|nr:diphosphate--fructose-6-phosphate 1-phosphotransferase [Candidatus Goldiibacteriota bacterium]
MTEISELQKLRLKYKPELPLILRTAFSSIKPKTGNKTGSAGDEEKLKEIFKNTFGKPVVTFTKGKNKSLNRKPIIAGVVLSGGQAAGGHNVICGIFDALKKANKKSRLLGFLGGPSGIIEGKMKELTKDIIDKYRNTGGFDIIGSGRTKIETDEQFQKTKETVIKNKIDALVIIGGDDSNTNAALLAEYFVKEKVNTQVIGIPKTIDGDLKNEEIETSFGFDTAVKIYAELTGNICRDVLSAKKYWHFIRLMGRSASHITLEVALQTHPNIALIGEEVFENKWTLSNIVDFICDAIVKRADAGKNYGVILVPEGLIEFIPEFKELIKNLNEIMAKNEKDLNQIESAKDKKEFIYTKLPENLINLMKSLPDEISSQLILDRDPHGNVVVSQIETEKLLIEMVQKKLKEMKKQGTYKGKFSAISHFFGYEGRCGFPSNFDANYTYALGFNAVLLILSGFTSYMSTIKNLTALPSKWIAGGTPLTMMMNIERRKGEDKPVIRKALVDLKGKPFKAFSKIRDKLKIEDNYISPGPIQYFGPSEIVNKVTETLKYEKN